MKIKNGITIFNDILIFFCITCNKLNLNLPWHFGVSHILTMLALCRVPPTPGVHSEVTGESPSDSVTNVPGC